MVEFETQETWTTSSVLLRLKSAIITTPLFRNKSFLTHKYTQEGLSARQIAVLIGTGHSTINSALVRFGIAKEERKTGWLEYGIKWENGRRVPHVRAQKIIASVANRRKHGWSYPRICRWLENRRIRSPSGQKRWLPASVRRLIKEANAPRVDEVARKTQDSKLETEETSKDSSVSRRGIMVWIAIILGMFLFYRFVERKHKILALKIGGALVVIGGILIGGFFAYDSYKEKQRKQGITVELGYKDLKLDKTLVQKLVDGVFNGMSQTVTSYYPDVGPTERLKIKEQLFYSYLEVKDAPEYAVIFPDGEFKALFAWVENKNPVTEKKLRVFEETRLKKWESELSDRRSKNTTQIQKFFHFAFLSRAKESFSFEEYKVSFLEKLLPEEKRGIDSFLGLKDSAYDDLYTAINGRSDLKTLFSFKVCNKRDRPLESYSFSVSGFDRGRSTAQALRRAGDYGSSTRFNGDIIIEPNKCSDIQWTGDYKFFNRYEVDGVYGTWKN